MKCLLTPASHWMANKHLNKNLTKLDFSMPLEEDFISSGWAWIKSFLDNHLDSIDHQRRQMLISTTNCSALAVTVGSELVILSCVPSLCQVESLINKKRSTRQLFHCLIHSFFKCSYVEKRQLTTAHIHSHVLLSVYFSSFTPFHKLCMYIQNHYYYISVSGVPCTFTDIYSLTAPKLIPLLFDSRRGSRYYSVYLLFLKCIYMEERESSRTRLQKSRTLLCPEALEAAAYPIKSS